MNYHVMTLFPEMIVQAAQTSILGRAIKNGHITLEAVNIRDYARNKHKKVDDYPYGGGAGMLMQAPPVYDCCQAILESIQKRKADEKDDAAETDCVKEANTKKTPVVYLTPQGEVFNQKLAGKLAKEEDIIFLCGHYEGIDERVLEEVVTDFVSIGDYVLTGGELPAMVMMDAIARLVPGVLSNEVSADFDTFYNDLLEYPQYSRPEEWRGKKIPEVLLSGNHKEVEKWRLEQSERRTLEKRPDLYARYAMKQEYIKKLQKKNKLLYMDMTENLKRGRGEIVTASQKGIAVRDAEARTYMLAVFEEAAAEELVRSLPGLEGCWKFVLHQECLVEAMEKRFSLYEKTACRHTVYTQRTPLPAAGNKKADIRPLDISYLDEVLAHYHMVPDRSYIEERLAAGNLYGAFVENRLAGFMGIHAEGSLGMLEVYEEYRRQGIGAALETCMLNKLLSKGYTPYGDVVTNNEASMNMQSRLGLYMCRETLYWVTAESTESAERKK